MWTARTLVPCLALAAGGPFLAWKVLDGELKGCDAALASLEGRPAVAWPFFAVLRPRTPSDAARFEFRYHHVEEGRAGTRAFGGGDGGTAAGNDGAWFLEDCDGAPCPAGKFSAAALNRRGARSARLAACYPCEPGK